MGDALGLGGLGLGPGLTGDVGLDELEESCEAIDTGENNTGTKVSGVIELSKK